MFWKRFLGIFGEDEAAKLLKQRGYKIIQRNYSCKYGEIDIIAKDGKTLVFIEVKTLSKGKGETPFDAITERKRRHIGNCAEYYLHDKKMKEIEIRFDAVAVWYEGKENTKIEVVKGAF